MRTGIFLVSAGLVATQVVGCASMHTRDLAHYPFPEAQEELREVLKGIINDAETGNVTSLRESHLKSDKFTKFGGRDFERLNSEQTTEDEAASAGSKQILEYDPRGLKIDVYGEVAIMTYYPLVSVIQDGEAIQYSSRQTLAFLKTADGWKIIHEHRTPKAWYEAWSER